MRCATTSPPARQRAKKAKEWRASRAGVRTDPATHAVMLQRAVRIKVRESVDTSRLVISRNRFYMASLINKSGPVLDSAGLLPVWFEIDFVSAVLFTAKPNKFMTVGPRVV